jgi:leader peptidase (prepilin peptidase)/N-methyltransferase
VAVEAQTSGQADHVAIRAPSSPCQTWAVRSAVRASHRATLGVAAVGTVAAASSAFAHDVPLAAAVPALALIPAALVDVIDRRLPNRMMVQALAITAAAVAATFILGGQLNMANAVIGAGCLSAPLLMIHLISPRSMGLGDVKAAAVLGTGLGLIAPELAFLALALGSAGAASVGLLRRRGDIAFGPGLVGGTIATLALVAMPINLVHSLDRSAKTGPPPLTVVREQETAG